MHLQLAVLNSESALLADKIPEPTYCDKCGATTVLTLSQTIHHYETCMGSGFKPSNYQRR